MTSVMRCHRRSTTRDVDQLYFNYDNDFDISSTPIGSSSPDVVTDSPEDRMVFKSLHRRRIEEAEFGVWELNQLRQHHQRLVENVIQSFRQKSEYRQDCDSDEVKTVTTSDEAAKRDSHVFESTSDCSEAVTLRCSDEKLSLTSNNTCIAAKNDDSFLLPVVMCGQTLNYPSPLHAVMLQFRPTVAAAVVPASHGRSTDELSQQQAYATTKSTLIDDIEDDDEVENFSDVDDIIVPCDQCLTVSVKTTSEVVSDVTSSECDSWIRATTVNGSLSLPGAVVTRSLSDVVSRTGSTASTASSEGYFSGSESLHDSFRFSSTKPTTSFALASCGVKQNGRRRLCKTFRRLPALIMMS